jgi:hypothetical protein
MILASHGIIGSSIVQGFDIDAQAFFDRVTTAGGSLSTTEQEAVNTLVVQMKADGIWAKMKAIYPMVGASAAACAQNLKSSSFTGTFTSGWTFASTGVTGNGTSTYMDSGLNQNNNLTPSNNHISIYSRTDVNGTTSPVNFQVDCGITNNTTHSFSQLLSRRNNLFILENGSQATSNSNNDSRGLFMGSATSSGLKSYKNGSVIGTNTTSQTRAMYNANIYFGATNDPLALIARYFSSRQYAFASIGDGLTDTEASNFYTAVQAMQVTLSRNV